MGDTGTSTGGGPASVDQNVAAGNLYVTPGTPTGLTASRVSDTQVNLAWSQSSAANGQPNNNDLSRSVNGAAWEENFVVVAATNSVSIGAAANQKIIYRVRAWKSGANPEHSSWSDEAAPVYTTPGAPNSLVATKFGSDIGLTFTSTVAYSEHTHEVWHGTVTGGVTTWDSSVLATLPAGTTTYTHVAPSSSVQHKYRVRAVGGGLNSAYAESGTVQLLAAPNKPSTPAVPAFTDKAAAFLFNWVHNPVDTTSQTAYEVNYSTNGGSTWSSTGKVTSATQSYTVPANTYAANVALSVRVRTWGQATTGGSEGTGASPWSDVKTVTFKTAPSTTITVPVNGGTVTDSTARVTLTFTQPESATFVSAQLELLQGAVLVETLNSSILTGITLQTVVADGVTYTVRARVRDSNGLWSSWVTSTFDVDYLPPVSAVVTVTYLPLQGYGQVDLLIGSPGAGEVAAVTVTVTRTIGGVTETLVEGYAVASALTFLDTTPVVRGTNTYTVTTVSSSGSQATVTADLVTAELRRAFLSKGAGYTTVCVIGANLDVGESLGVAAGTVQAAGRVKPIGLYGVETSVRVKVTSTVIDGFGSTVDELRGILLAPGRACYRDPSGRRLFGSVQGSVGYSSYNRRDVSFTLTETS